MKFLPYRDRGGVTFVEIIVVIGILLTLIGIAAVSFVPTRGNISLDTAISELVTELKSQQIKAMSGDTEGRGTNDNYGIYFEQSRYTLFHGTSYSITEPSNVSIMLAGTIRISSVELPSSSIIFEMGEGNVAGFSSTQNSITLEDSITGRQKTIIINRYGVITSVN